MSHTCENWNDWAVQNGDLVQTKNSAERDSFVFPFVLNVVHIISHYYYT